MSRVLSGIAVLLSRLSFVGGLVYLAGGSEVDVGGTAGRIVVGLGLLAASAAVLFGLWGVRSPGRLRAFGMTAGAVFFGICFWWTVVAPLMAVAVALFGVRGRKRAGLKRAEAPPVERSPAA